MARTTSRRSNGSRRERILDYLSSQGGRIDSADGRGLTSKMASRVGYDNIAALNAILARLERDGEIKRVVRGKRTYSIALRGRAPRSARPKDDVTRAGAATRKAGPARGGRPAAGRPAAGRPAAGRPAAGRAAARRAAPGRAAPGRGVARRTPAGRAVAASTPGRGSVRSGPSRGRRQSTRAGSTGNNLPQLLAALGNELLALRDQNDEMRRRIAALEAAARPATRRAGGRRAA
jgi:hypothetical protein